jgi:hypothetical protein
MIAAVPSHSQRPVCTLTPSIMRPVDCALNYVQQKHHSYLSATIGSASLGGRCPGEKNASMKQCDCGERERVAADAA